MIKMINGKDIICISPSYWDETWGTAQQFMSLLSKTNRVLYVEPSPSYRYLLQHPGRWSKFFAFRRGLLKSKEHKNLWITVPPPTPPFKRYIDILKRVDHKIILRRIKQAMKQLGFSNPILWLILPTSVEFAGKLDEFLVYHCFDEFAAVPGRRRSSIEEHERQLLARADLVITCSENVFEAKAPYCKEVINIPNGVDFDFFNEALDESLSIAPDLEKYSDAPIIGYSGSVDYRLDDDFLIQAATSYPDYRFVFVGPVNKKFSRLKTLPNIVMLGEKPMSEIPSYIKGFDVCLIPYELNEFSINTSPLKVFEYLAAGKPVVASDIRAIRDLKDVIFIGQSRREMIDAIQFALKKNDGNAVKARVKRARENTWQHRVDTASEKISELYNKNETRQPTDA